jgi:pimeloyl-ACP methyl ester carboxylesterase
VNTPSSATPKDYPVEHRYADLGDVRLHYVEAGEGPLVVLLHGFPEFWYSWRLQIPALAEAGFRVVAPDMRGYNLSDKPRGAKNYRAELLGQDVVRLIRACGEERASVVGHDWGAAVAWMVAMHHPKQVEEVAILNVPHPERFLRGLRTLRQLRKSWYIFFFQIPWLPEIAVRAGNFAPLRAAFRNDRMRAGAFSSRDIERYVEAISRPGALTAAINYYRALFRLTPTRARRQIRRVEMPVLVIWGEQDRYLGAELAEPARNRVPNVRVERLPDASHWVQLDRPEKVNALLLEFLSNRCRRGS